MWQNPEEIKGDNTSEPKRIKYNPILEYVHKGILENTPSVGESEDVRVYGWIWDCLLTVEPTDVLTT